MKLIFKKKKKKMSLLFLLIIRLDFVWEKGVKDLTNKVVVIDDIIIKDISVIIT